MQLGERIKHYRTQKNRSQKDVALTIGIDRAQYSRIETGKVAPTIASLEKIAQALGVSMVDLFAEKEPVDVNSFDKPFVERLELIDKLDKKQKELIYGVIDTFLTNQKLKEVLENAAQIAK